MCKPLRTPMVPADPGVVSPAVSLFVAGVPAPKGSRTLGRRRDGSTFTRPASNGEHRWAETVARAALAARARSSSLPGPPYAVRLDFRMPRPARPTHRHPSTSDVDKLARCVVDALVVGGLLTDDRHVVELVAAKAYVPADGEPGVVVHITEVGGCP